VGQTIETEREYISRALNNFGIAALRPTVDCCVQLRQEARAETSQTVLALLGCIEATELHGWWHRESTRADLLAFAAAVRAELEGR
jgi:hypothetical protein